MEARVAFVFPHFVLHILAHAGSGSGKNKKFNILKKFEKKKKVWNTEGVEAHVKMACRPDKVGQEVEACVYNFFKKKVGKFLFEK